MFGRPPLEDDIPDPRAELIAVENTPEIRRHRLISELIASETASYRMSDLELITTVASRTRSLPPESQPEEAVSAGKLNCFRLQGKAIQKTKGDKTNA